MTLTPVKEVNTNLDLGEGSLDLFDEDTTKQPSIEVLPGFIQASPTKAEPTIIPMFVSVDANAKVGSPIYCLRGSERQHPPSTFIGHLHSIETTTRMYEGNFKPYSKVIFRLTVGGLDFNLFLGLNSWASQTLLQSLSHLTTDELKGPLKFHATAGTSSCFMSISYRDSSDAWTSINPHTETLSSKLDEGELRLLVGSVDELLN